MMMTLSLTGNGYSGVEEGVFRKRSCGVYFHLLDRVYLVSTTFLTLLCDGYAVDCSIALL